MKTTYAKACEFLKSLMCDFAAIDVEIHPILENQVGLPLIDQPMVIVNGIQEMNYDATNFPKLSIICTPIKTSENSLLLVGAFH